MVISIFITKLICEKIQDLVGDLFNLSSYIKKITIINNHSTKTVVTLPSYFILFRSKEIHYRKNPL